ncbi:putative transcriptional regulator [Pedobacter cryoconitis]|uniref:Putative transcriptional regulator n=1 Tax=Pedobacter cryoconitis TaxID=188932 RepID=A0A7W8ZPC2_9SPHI|nr:hypothetical protein [Pedobacter cryoconitis]MBB5637560.1 putative transcriptional regulator [Pedobacter cryoconitis]MBB6269987.1 putative transcriptional regulator [Pedobacter cryoconitis]
MKLFIKMLIITSFLVTILPVFSNAQNRLKKEQNTAYLKTVDSIFNKGFKSSELKDSIALYAFNFNIDLVKNNNGKTEIKQISVNDNLAYRLFPSYIRLNSVNFSSLMSNRKKLRLVVPILISNNSETAVKKYKKDDGNSLIDMQAALNIAYSLYSDIPYNNLKDANISLEHRIYRAKKDNNTERISKDIVYLNPYVIRILNIR